MTLQVPPRTFLLGLSDWRLPLCDVCGSWVMGWASSTMYSHSRKEEIQELVFSSQLTNHCLACCWGPWVSLSCTSPGFISPGLCLLSGGGTNMSQTVGHSPWPRGPKAEFFQIDFVYGVFVCTLPLQRSKAFSCVSIQPMTVDPRWKASWLPCDFLHLSHPPQLSLKDRPWGKGNCY